MIEFNDIPPSAHPGIMPTKQSLRVLAEIVALWAERRQNTHTDMPRTSSQLSEAVCAFEGVQQSCLLQGALDDGALRRAASYTAPGQAA